MSGVRNKRKINEILGFNDLVELSRKKQKTVDAIPKYYITKGELEAIYENVLAKAKGDFIEEYAKSKTKKEQGKILQQFKDRIIDEATKKTYKIIKNTEKEGYTKPDDENLNNASIHNDIAVYEDQPFLSLVNTPEELFRMAQFFKVLQEKTADELDFEELELEEGSVLVLGGKKKSKSNQKKKSKRKQKTKHRRKSTRKSRRKPRLHKK